MTPTEPQETEDARGSSRAIALALVAVLTLYGLVVRLHGRDFGLPYLQHWDESPPAFTALRMLQTGDFNPHFFTYPGFLVYGNAAVDVAHYYALMGVGPWSSRYLGSLDALQTRGRPENAYISHPSFISWNRTLTVVLGTLCIPATYALGEAALGVVAGLVGALTIACLPLHVGHSRFVTTDVPLCLFVVLTTLFAVRYLRGRLPRDFLLACGFSGVVVAIKYSGFLILLLPALALIAGKKRPLLFIALPVVPALVFLGLDPYALLDFGDFLRQTGYEVQHYRVLGHETAEIYPGLPHLAFQIPQILHTLTPWLFYPALLGGLLALARFPAGPLLLVFPIVYTGYMCQQRASFHRNLICVYPFLAVFLGHFVSVTGCRLARVARRRFPSRFRSERGPFRLLLLLALVTIGWRLGAVSLLRGLGRSPAESRSRAITLVNEIARKDGRKDVLVGLCSQLSIHELDQRRLDVPFEELDQADLPAALARYDYVLVTLITSRDPQQGGLRKRNALVRTLDPAWIAGRIDGRPMPLDEPAVDPLVMIVRSPHPVRRATTFRPRESPEKIEGFYDGAAWTNGLAKLHRLGLTVPEGARALVVTMRGEHPWQASPRAIHLEVTADGQVLTLTSVSRRAFVFALPSEMETIDEIVLASATFRPSITYPRSTDTRNLGADVDEIRIE